MEYACNTRAGMGMSEDCNEDAVVKLRGLPYDASKMQIAEFFQGRFLSLAMILISPTFKIINGIEMHAFYNWESKEILFRNNNI